MGLQASVEPVAEDTVPERDAVCYDGHGNPSPLIVRDLKDFGGLTPGSLELPNGKALDVAIQVALGYGDHAYIQEILLSVKKGGLQFRTCQFLCDVYGYALDGVVTHDLFVWEALIKVYDPKSNEVTREVMDTQTKRLVVALQRVMAMPTEKFVQEWLQRDGGVKHTLELIRLINA